MSTSDDARGHLDDSAEAGATSSDTPGGPAAEGEYDPAEGSPGHTEHPVGEGFPDEAVTYDDADGRPRSETGE